MFDYASVVWFLRLSSIFRRLWLIPQRERERQRESEKRKRQIKRESKTLREKGRERERELIIKITGNAGMHNLLLYDLEQKYGWSAV